MKNKTKDYSSDIEALNKKFLEITNAMKADMKELRELRSIIAEQSKKASKSIAKNDAALLAVKKGVKSFTDRIESFEESLMYIYHNIKKNQFLYAHYPDDWVKEYLSIKDGLKHENEL